MPSLMTLAAPAIAVGALLAPGCEPGCVPAENRGLVWEAEDTSRVTIFHSQPVFGSAAADETQLRITKLLWVDPGAPGTISDQCEAEIAAYAAQWIETPQSRCLYVELVMTADDTTGGQVVDGPMSRVGGGVTEGCCTDDLAPGESRLAGTFYPGIEPGSTLRWDVATGATFVTYEHVVFGPEWFQPFTWEF
ncbi:MAG: hypothetical protein ACRDZ2_05885 [Ilumatobacteraceae bacterium]